MDIQSTADQSEMEASQYARPFAAFYKRLIEEKVDEHTASQLTLMYAKQMMHSPPAGT